MVQRALYGGAMHPAGSANRQVLLRGEVLFVRIIIPSSPKSGQNVEPKSNISERKWYTLACLRDDIPYPAQVCTHWMF